MPTHTGDLCPFGGPSGFCTWFRVTSTLPSPIPQETGCETVCTPRQAGRAGWCVVRPAGRRVPGLVIPARTDQSCQAPGRHPHATERCCRGEREAEKACPRELGTREQNAKCNPHGRHEAGSDADKLSSLNSRVRALHGHPALTYQPPTASTPTDLLQDADGAVSPFLQTPVGKAPCTSRSQLSDLLVA